MTSLAEAYDGAGRIPRRLYVGTGLFLAGTVLVVVGIVLTTTEVYEVFGWNVFDARRLAGVTGGLGVPAVLVGAFTVLPASQRERAAAAIGSGIAVLGVALFWHAYPAQWYYPGVENHLTLPVVTVYFLGVITTFWSLFTATVNLKTRTPGGTVTLQHIIGERPVDTTTSSDERTDATGGGSPGGVGVFGAVTAEPTDHSSGAETLTAAASDGGTADQELRTPNPDPDRYCGNCTHFDYVDTEDGFRPYCGYHEEPMDDMEACSQWSSNAAPENRA